MKIRTSIIALAAALPLAAFAAPPSAADLLHKAEATALASQRNVLLVYGASWCGWCHKLDAALKSPEISAVVDKAYVVVHVDVMEQGEKKSLENPGGLEQMHDLVKVDPGGVPVFVILDAHGTVLGTSMKPGSGNIGYPGEPGEIDYFMTLVRKSTPMLADAERTKLETYFRREGAKLQHQGH